MVLGLFPTKTCNLRSNHYEIALQLATYLVISVGPAGSEWIRLQEHRSWCWPGRGKGRGEDPRENQLELDPIPAPFETGN
jgi:hypothetical protein